MKDDAKRIAQRAADIEAALAKIPLVPVPYVPVDVRQRGRLAPSDAPLSFEEAASVATFRAPSKVALDALAKLAEEDERQRRKAWGARFAVARASIPDRFSWLLALPAEQARPDTIAASLVAFLPWISRAHVDKLWRAWKDRVSVLICGAPGLGKTTLALVHAVWTLQLASFDARAIRERREALAAWSRDKGPLPPEPEWLPEVREAQHLRFVSATDLLMPNQRDVDERAMMAAFACPMLYLDEVGRELYGATGDSYLANSRRPAVSKVAENFWRAGHRVVATSSHRPEVLADLYDGGTFRRFVEGKSGACVIDLDDPAWAGTWAREQSKARRAAR